MATSKENGVGHCRFPPQARSIVAVTESYMSNLFLKASMVALHAKRMTVDDLRLLAALKNVNELDGMSHVSLEASEPVEKRSRQQVLLDSSHDGWQPTTITAKGEKTLMPVCDPEMTARNAACVLG